MRKKIILRGKTRSARKWGDVRISGSGTLYIKPGDVLRRRVRTLLQKKRADQKRRIDLPAQKEGLSHS